MRHCSYSESTKPTPCPYCGSDCYADFVDVDVCMVQCGPYFCDSCHASEIGPNDDKSRELNEDEKRTGWYRPGAPVGSSCNTVGGVLIRDHEVAHGLYRLGLLDAPVDIQESKESQNENG